MEAVKNFAATFSRLIFFSGMLMCMFSSCSSGVRIEKRHYNNGFYVSLGNDKIKKEVAVDSTPSRNNSPTVSNFSIPTLKANSIVHPVVSNVSAKAKNRLTEKSATRKHVAGKNKTTIPVFKKNIERAKNQLQKSDPELEEAISTVKMVFDLILMIFLMIVLVVSLPNGILILFGVVLPFLLIFLYIRNGMTKTAFGEQK